MEAESEVEKAEEGMLPGFRFHPTDEELVGFYLKRKVQRRSVSIELIRQLDIYKYDPWDLPKLASAGEKEWYFYCPRDRKYRNSARPNRVTASGFWKATGTDRAIYTADGAAACIGLKKSLVFYRGRAAKGLKTDWMMHEYRLPPKENSPNDSWAICRIFKKTCSAPRRAFLPPDDIKSCDNGILSSELLSLPESSSCSLDAAAALFQYMQPHQQLESFPGLKDQSPEVRALTRMDLLMEMAGNVGKEGERDLKNPEMEMEMEGNEGFGDESQWGTLGAAVLPFARLRSRLWEERLPSLLG